VLTSVIRPVACAGIPVRAAGFLVAGTLASGTPPSLSKVISGSVPKGRRHDRVMRFWRRPIVPLLAALAVVLLGAASASGVDQMAKTNLTNAASVTIPDVPADGRPPLRQLVMLGLADGSLPGGFPYDELREEKYDENYPETLHLGPAATQPR
jgi:hypothetical protein